MSTVEYIVLAHSRCGVQFNANGMKRARVCQCFVSTLVCLGFFLFILLDTRAPSAKLLWKEERRWEEDWDRNQTRVLLLAYPRSGSSLLGHLLFRIRGAAYFFEPLHVYRQRQKLIDEGKGMGLLDRIFRCEGEVLSEMIENAFVNRYSLAFDDCRNAKVIFLKTIRLRLDAAFHWLSRRTDLYVVHLVRDPRAILRSLTRAKYSSRDPRVLCPLIQNDLRLGRLLSPQRYVRIRYEDLVQRPEETMKKILHLVNVDFDQPKLWKTLEDLVIRNIPSTPELLAPFDEYTRGVIREECDEVMNDLEYADM
ncbi:unnamed protein product [Darwinula stevensoni]|uniref:Sulfotransferase n=1 Tax=Darwinula stevensoni TaxID=69355 RepID=A0A7R8X797_9CRUS|nr:unnamed protein product [Darwinula stevensoni]CAG0888872.1 unnamed protein product [Darwinula stevensoni]